MSSYCPACAEAFTPSAGAGGREACPRCGLVLVDERDAVRIPASALNDMILIAEDTALIRMLLKEGLVAEGLAKRVFTAEDGQQFLELYADQLYHDRPVDLVLLDLEMPVLGGGNTAIAMRGMEKGCGAKPATIIFFTSHGLSDALRGLMHFCRPAHYLNKGADASAPRIIKRLREVMRALRM